MAELAHNAERDFWRPPVVPPPTVVGPNVKSGMVEVCDRCHGYLKTITPFTPIPAEQVVLQDLATVGLDVAAVERGYRPPSPRDPLAVSIVARRSGLRARLAR